MNRAIPFLLALITLFLVACGGGGGGGTSLPVSLSYRTLWTTRADPASGDGQSQLITITKSTGETVLQRVLNRDTASGIDFDELTPGSYLLTATLYSLPDTSGQALGEVQIPFTLSNPVTLTTQVGSTVSQVQVASFKPQIEVETTAKFYATARDSSGNAVFVDFSAFQWAGLGGVASVSSTGVATGSQAGSGTVRATYSAGAISGSTGLTVTAPNTTTSKWTVLVYLNAANDLYSYSDTNIDQMERVASNPDVRFAVQWKQSRRIFPNSSFDGCRRLLVTPNATQGVQSPSLQDMGTNVDMGAASTLADFIAWGKRNYPAERYVLVVWNHGSGWSRGATSRAVSYDDETGNVIQIWELRQALANQHVDILAWDASLMQMLEVAYEVKDHADYVVGSEESPPGEGYPYDLVFDGFKNNPSASTADLSRGFVTGMNTYPPYESRKITQSVIRTDRLTALAGAVDRLGQSLITHRTSVLTAFTNARQTSQAYSPSTSRYYRDLLDLVSILRAQSGIPTEVNVAAADVQTAVTDALVWEGHNSNSANSRGIAIDASPGSRFAGVQADYRNLLFAQDTSWDEWLLQSP